jgi:hypothetical protein
MRHETPGARTESEAFLGVFHMRFGVGELNQPMLGLAVVVEALLHAALRQEYRKVVLQLEEVTASAVCFLIDGPGKHYRSIQSVAERLA